MKYFRLLNLYLIEILPCIGLDSGNKFKQIFNYMNFSYILVIFQGRLFHFRKYQYPVLIFRKKEYFPRNDTYRGEGGHEKMA